MQSRRTVPAVLVLVALLLMRTSILRAENVIELRVNAGDTIEIGTDSKGKKPEFSWILTKDRKFQNAQRSRFFQTRFAQAGTYILDVSVQDPAGGANDYRAFTINVADQPSNSPQLVASNLETTPLQAVLQSTSPIVDGKIYVPTDGGLIKIDPSLSAGKISSYDIDIDSTVDSNGDGNPTNDRDTADSLSSKTGSPIYLYVVPKPEQRVITLTVSSLTNPTPSMASLEIAYGTAPASSTQSSSSVAVGVIQNPGSPITIQKSGNRVRLEAHLDASSTATKELLYEWDFGDRAKSLLTSPTHTYATDGTYTITLTVRDISTGAVIVTDVTSISIEGSPASSSTSSTSTIATSVDSSTSSSAKNSEGESSGSFGAILWVGSIMFVIFLLFLGLVGIIIFVKSRFTGKLQDTLEKMEKTIVQPDDKQRIVETKVEPMKLKKDDEQKDAKKEAIIDQEKSRQEMKNASLRTNETPVNTAGPVPSWLAKSPSTPPAPSPAPNKPMNATDTKPLATAPVPAPVPTSVTQPSPPAPSTAPAPSWLKPSAPVTSATEKPLSQTTSTAGPVPAWLEKKSAPSVEAPAPAPVTVSAPPVTPEPKPVTPPTVSGPTPRTAPPPPPTMAPARVVEPTPTPATAVTQVEKPSVTEKSELSPPAPSGEPKPVVAVPVEQQVRPAVPTAPVTDKSNVLTATQELPSHPMDTKEITPDKAQTLESADTSDDDTPVAFIQADSLTNDAQK